jgi:hypothetical protein
MPEAGVEPALIAAWLAGRSKARGLPAPVPDHGGLRVDTSALDETRRYVFARPCDGLAALGRTIDDPLILLKLCAAPEVMAPLIGPRWTLDGAASVMTSPTVPPFRATLPGYTVEVEEQDGVLRCTIRSAAGETAASGFAVEQGGVFVFDRIVTEPGHRRRGLGSLVMATLAGRRNSPDSHYLLVATPDGRALYRSLGWNVLAPYTTATLRR